MNYYSTGLLEKNKKAAPTSPVGETSKRLTDSKNQGFQEP